MGAKAAQLHIFPRGRKKKNWILSNKAVELRLKKKKKTF